VKADPARNTELVPWLFFLPAGEREKRNQFSATGLGSTELVPWLFFLPAGEREKRNQFRATGFFGVAKVTENVLIPQLRTVR
jgi:hypothetical protein